MRHALLALLSGCLMALGIAGIALREPSRAPDGPGETALAPTAAPDLRTQPPAPTVPSTPCVSPFEVVASSLPATLGATAGRGSVTVRVAPLPEG